MQLVAHAGGAALAQGGGERVSGARTHIRWRWKLTGLGVATAALWLALAWSEAALAPVSRRLMNLSYTLWVLAVQSLMLLLLGLIDLFATRARGSIIMAAVNRNQLAFFLAANLSTGAVNLSMRTIYAPRLVGFGVVAAYITVLCSAAVFVDRRLNLSIKL